MLEEAPERAHVGCRVRPLGLFLWARGFRDLDCAVLGRRRGCALPEVQIEGFRV